jgi:hypothetical protein
MPDAIQWTYDRERNCWDGWRNGRQVASVAKDGSHTKPWAAYHTAETGYPDSWHITWQEAKKACEAAHA